MDVSVYNLKKWTGQAHDSPEWTKTAYQVWYTRIPGKGKNKEKERKGGLVASRDSGRIWRKWTAGRCPR